jgi:hypothetical protein
MGPNTSFYNLKQFEIYIGDIYIYISPSLLEFRKAWKYIDNGSTILVVILEIEIELVFLLEIEKFNILYWY